VPLVELLTVTRGAEAGRAFGRSAATPVRRPLVRDAPGLLMLSDLARATTRRGLRPGVENRRRLTTR
jgi:hypothetical protein